MTIRDLTEEQVKELQKTADRFIEARKKGSHVNKPIDPVDYKLFFSDGVKAILAHITSL